jgi:hypothetical protein
MPKSRGLRQEARAFSEVLDNPDSYLTWAVNGEPDFSATPESLVGGVITRFTGRTSKGQPIGHTDVFLKRAEDIADYYQQRDQMLDGYRHFEAAGTIISPATRALEASHFFTIGRKSQLDMERRGLTVVAAYALHRLEEDGQLASCFDVSRAFIRQTQAAASEAGVVQRHNKAARGILGRLRRMKFLEDEEYAEQAAVNLAWRFFPNSEAVDLRLRQQTASKK